MLLCTCGVASLQAQAHRRVVPTPQNDRAVSEASASMSSYQVMVRQKEAQLSQFLRQFQAGSASTKNRLEPQIKTLLYDIFDLNIAEKEAEAEELRKQLNRLSTDQAYHDHSEQILTLKQSLSLVEAVIRERKTYRQAIVNRRLKELMGI